MKPTFIALLASALAASPAHATFLVDTGAPTGTNFEGVYFDSFSALQSLGARFVLDADAQVDSLEGWFSVNGAAQINFALFSETISAPTQLLTQGLAATTGEGWQGLSGLGLDLAAGSYWLTFTVIAPSPTVRMRLGAPSPVAAYAAANNANGLNWTDVDYSFGVRVGGTSDTGAVPEPAAWALMIAGLGLVGASMRRRAHVALRFG